MQKINDHTQTKNTTTNHYKVLKTKIIILKFAKKKVKLFSLIH